MVAAPVPAELRQFSDPTLLVLCSLAGGPKHGYAIIGDVERFAGVTLGPGTLYGALARLQRLGLVERLEREDRRQPYRLSELGARALRAQLDGLRRVSRTAARRLAVG